MDVQIGPRTEMTEDRSDQGPKWMHTVKPIVCLWGVVKMFIRHELAVTLAILKTNIHSKYLIETLGKTLGLECSFLERHREACVVYYTAIAIVLNTLSVIKITLFIVIDQRGRNSAPRKER